MAKVLNYESQISQSLVIQSWHVSQSVDAFTGADAFDITLSGSSTVTGTNIMSSSASPSITSILTENDSHPFIQNVTTTGPNFRMDLADADSSGSSTLSFGRQSGAFGGTGLAVKYTTGSNASQGEIIMSLGKNGSLGALQDRFIVQSEPGPIATNGNSELTLSVGGPSTGRRQVLGNVQDGTGEFANFGVGIDNEFGRKRFVSFEYSSNSTSSQAGFTSSSLSGTGVPNFNVNSIPFGITAGGFSTSELTNTVFYIDRGGSLGAIQPVTASLQISRGGSINMEGDITASGDIIFEGNVSGSGANSSYTGDEFNAHGNDGNSGFTLLSLTNKPILFASNDKVNLGPPITTTIPTKLTSDNVEILGDVSGSGSGLFQAGKPIVTHTTHVTNSLANAGRYHIVGGNLTCSVQELPTTPVGAEFEFFQTSSAGQFLFETGSGTSILSKDGNLKLVGQGSAATLKKVAGATYHLIGDLTS
tara:strand:+ start:1301 stop:2728 length:1428 start_codon:yes stop_codon:yes gene_type:complete